MPSNRGVVYLGPGRSRFEISTFGFNAIRQAKRSSAGQIKGIEAPAVVLNSLMQITRPAGSNRRFRGFT